MKIGIQGGGWRAQMTQDIVRQLGVVAGIAEGFSEDLTLVCAPGAGIGRAVEDYVRNGGRAVVLYPERELMSLFGAELLYTYPFPYLQNLREDLPISLLQVFPPVTLIRPGEGESWANFALDFTKTSANGTSRYPALIWRECGQGRIGMFLYDLPATLLLLQQGWEFFSSSGDFPAWRRDGVARASYLYQNLIREPLAHLPQAYLHEILFLSFCRQVAGRRNPLSRIWYYPHGQTSALLLSGDSDLLPRDKLEEAWSKLGRLDVPYTQFIMLEDLAAFSSAELKKWEAQGIDFALHYFAGRTPTAEEMKTHLGQARDLFERRNLTFDAARGHSLAWVGWDEQVRLMAGQGLTISSNMFYWLWGVSQGFPYHLYTEQGRSPLRELQIFSSDDITLHNKGGAVTLPPAEAAHRMNAVLDTMRDLYYQPFNPAFHPHYFAGHKPDTTGWLTDLIAHAREKNIPVMNYRQFFAWWESRNLVVEQSRTDEQGRVRLAGPSGGVAVAVPEEWAKENRPGEGLKLPGTSEVLLSDIGET